MRKFILISLLVFAGFNSRAQYDLSIIGNVVEAYFETMGQSDLELRKKGLDSLLTSQANITAVLLGDNGKSSITSGTANQFLDDSEAFYADFSIKFDEQAREVDYYLELASVHVLVDQLSTKKSNRRIYEQHLWLQMDLVFYNERWHISNILWINESSRDIRGALVQDTLVRVP
ncbi:MAG: hypothetical protein Salg2KO_09720 [Salibacteraceae bacterium]